jgi:hypothetical protein
MSHVTSIDLFFNAILIKIYLYDTVIDYRRLRRLILATSHSHWIGIKTSRKQSR